MGRREEDTFGNTGTSDRGTLLDTISYHAPACCDESGIVVSQEIERFKAQEETILTQREEFHSKEKQLNQQVDFLKRTVARLQAELPQPTGELESINLDAITESLPITPREPDDSIVTAVPSTEVPPTTTTDGIATTTNPQQEVEYGDWDDDYFQEIADVCDTIMASHPDVLTSAPHDAVVTPFVNTSSDTTQALKQRTKSLYNLDTSSVSSRV